MNIQTESFLIRTWKFFGVPCYSHIGVNSSAFWRERKFAFRSKTVCSFFRRFFTFFFGHVPSTDRLEDIDSFDERLNDMGIELVAPPGLTPKVQQQQRNNTPIRILFSFLLSPSPPPRIQLLWSNLPLPSQVQVCNLFLLCFIFFSLNELDIIRSFTVFTNSHRMRSTSLRRFYSDFLVCFHVTTMSFGHTALCCPFKNHMVTDISRVQIGSLNWFC